MSSPEKTKSRPRFLKEFLGTKHKLNATESSKYGASLTFLAFTEGVVIAVFGSNPELALAAWLAAFASFSVTLGGAISRSEND